MKATRLAIINPVAGFPRSERQRQAEARRILHHLDAEAVFTEYAGHATRLASASAADDLIVFGGDGTVAEVVNGMDLARQRLQILPGGTGNGLARDLGLSSVSSALARARAGHEHQLDLIKVTFRAGGQSLSRLAISTISIGYAAGVVALANRGLKRLGRWCYPLASLVQATRQRPFCIHVQIDQADASERILSNVMVNNTSFAGNFRPFRHADPGDGYFEVLLVRAAFAQQVLHNLAVLSGAYFYATASETRSRAVAVRMAIPQQLMIDGEVWSDVSEARFDILPGTLRCVA